MDIMQKTVNTELVRFAVQTAITCPGCKRILDVDNAVLVTNAMNDRNAIACGACWDRDRSKLTSEQLAQLDVIDSRPPRPKVAPIKGTRGTVKLAFPKGKGKRAEKRETTALIFGALAVHRENRPAALYTITHVATGYAVATRLPLDAARQLVAALQPLDWSFTTPTAVPRETRERAVDIIRPFLRSRR